MNDKERFILAEKIQKRVQGSQPHFELIKRKDEIEKQLKIEIENRRSWTINENKKMWIVGRKNTLYPGRIIKFGNLASVRCIKIKVY